MIELANERIVVTGGAGFLGRAVTAALSQAGVPEDRILVPRRSDFDLTSETAVQAMYASMRPTIVIHLAAEVGGIGANRQNPGRFFYSNMAMGLHLIEHARRFDLRKFVQVGTVCSYPADTPAPFREEHLWDGYPEPTNAPYGIAKKAVLTMLQAYRMQYGLQSVYLMPANLYGPGDHFDLANSHVIPAMIRRFFEARETGASSVTLWGTGGASREFLFVDDCAKAIVKAAACCESPEPINVGTGREILIRDLAKLIQSQIGYTGEIQWDPTMPDGQRRRVLDTQRAETLLGWRASTTLEDGLRRTIDWYIASRANAEVHRSWPRE